MGSDPLPLTYPFSGVACGWGLTPLFGKADHTSVDPSNAHHNSDGGFMIAMAPHILRTNSPRMEFEHLLLGDLRELLNDDPSRERDRWLLATLDMLLMFRPRTAQVFLPAIPRDSGYGRSEGDLPIPFEKLQRLRDRIAHRAPYEALAQELTVDLRNHFEGSRSKLEQMLPLG